jgi:nitrate reductase NapE component
MINIEKHISELVGNHDCVIVAGLGAFIAQATSADIHPITHKFTAPGRTLSFNAQIKVNDGLLAAEISRKESISFQEATALIDDFVKKFNSSLSLYKYYTMNEIGRFFYNLEGKLEFEPDFTINFSSESFGLTDFVFKPIERNSYDMESTNKHRNAKDAYAKEEGTSTKKSSAFAKVIFILMPLVVLVGAAGFVVYNQQQDISLGGINIFESLGLKNENVAVDSSASIVDSVAINQDAEIVVDEYTSSEVIEEPVVEVVKHKNKAVIASSELVAGSYYIVVGSFKNEANADRLFSELNSQNKAAVKMPVDANGFYKVAIGTFATLDAANADFASVQASYNGSWIKKY